MQCRSATSACIVGLDRLGAAVPTTLKSDHFLPRSSRDLGTGYGRMGAFSLISEEDVMC